MNDTRVIFFESFMSFGLLSLGKSGSECHIVRPLLPAPLPPLGDWRKHPTAAKHRRLARCLACKPLGEIVSGWHGSAPLLRRVCCVRCAICYCFHKIIIQQLIGRQ